jgi:DNA-directed RNA polymerase specialized sigma24 family protein
MSELDTRWTAYLHLQIRSGRRRRMDATGWGLEAGLNHILVGQVDESSAAAAAERGTARERHHARLRFQYFDPHQVDDPTAKLDDINRLRHLLASVCSDDRRMLLATGFGHDSAAVASIVSMKPDAVRQRVARLRAKMASVC